MTIPPAAVIALRELIRKRRRHVEASPGVGADRQHYALAVLDDVEADLDALVARVEPPEGHLNEFAGLPLKHQGFAGVTNSARTFASGAAFDPNNNSVSMEKTGYVQSATARVEPPPQEQDWTERARKWIVRETHTNTHGLASFCEEARHLIWHAYPEAVFTALPSPPTQEPT